MNLVICSSPVPNPQFPHWASSVILFYLYNFQCFLSLFHSLNLPWLLTKCPIVRFLTPKAYYVLDLANLHLWKRYASWYHLWSLAGLGRSPKLFAGGLCIVLLCFLANWYWGLVCSRMLLEYLNSWTGWSRQSVRRGGHPTTKCRTPWCIRAAWTGSSTGWHASLCWYTLFARWSLVPYTLVCRTLWKCDPYSWCWKFWHWAPWRSRSQPVWVCQSRIRLWSFRAWYLYK